MNHLDASERHVANSENFLFSHLRLSLAAPVRIVYGA